MKKLFLFFLILLIPAIVTGDDWIPLPIAFNECDPGECFVDIGSYLQVGQYEIVAESVAPTGRSGFADLDKPLLIVEAATPGPVIEQLEKKGWYVRKLGLPVNLAWNPATYTIDGVVTPVPRYEFFSRRVARIGACDKPTGVSIK